MATSARFIYRNSKGETKEQCVHNVSDKGLYFSGYSEAHGMVRTFRKDRVIDWLDDGAAEDLPESKRIGALSVAFTGLPKEERERLTDLAQDGGMTVRQSVSQTLDFLCAGEGAGPAKINKAHRQDVLVLRPDHLERMLETGEVPTRSLVPPQVEPVPKRPSPAADNSATAQAEKAPAKAGASEKAAAKRRWHWASFIWGWVAGWAALLVLGLFL